MEYLVLMCGGLQVGSFISIGRQDKLIKGGNIFMIPTGTGPMSIVWLFNERNFDTFEYMQFHLLEVVISA